MGSTWRAGFRSGLVFGVVTVFFVLIGFLTVVSDLIQRALPDAAIDGAGLAILLAGLGVWAGWRGAPRTEPDRMARALLGGSWAGVAMGAVVAVFVVMLADLAARGTDMRYYLTQLSPDTIERLLFGRVGAGAAVLPFVLCVGGGILGGVAARTIGRGQWRAPAARRRSELRAAWRTAPLRVRLASALPPAGWRLVRVVAAVTAVLVVPLLLGNYWNFTLGTVGIYVLMALGLNIVVGLAGLLDLGYVAFFAVGAYTVALLTAPSPHGLMWSFWVAALLGIAAAATAGIILGVPVLRLRGDYLAIVTLGFGEIIRILIKSEALTGLTGGPQGVRDIGGPGLSERGYVYLIALAIALVITVTVLLERSRVGRAWVAMREDETVAQAMGISVYRAKLLAFAIGAAFAGLGGALFAARNQYTGPEDHNLMVSINVLCMVIVGGMGSIPGVILGAFTLKGLPEVLRQVEEYRMLAFGALLVAMMAFRPQGLWPSRRRRLAGASASPMGPRAQPGVDAPDDAASVNAVPGTPGAPETAGVDRGGP